MPTLQRLHKNYETDCLLSLAENQMSCGFVKMRRPTHPDERGIGEDYRGIPLVSTIS